MLIMFGVGLVFILIGMVYGRIVDTKRCDFCRALVPKANVEGGCCIVCRRGRLKYPFGSTEVPAQKKCDQCNRMFYPLPYLRPLTRDGKRQICIWCVDVLKSAVVELVEYAKARGVALTPSLAEAWGMEQLGKPCPTTRADVLSDDEYAASRLYHLTTLMETGEWGDWKALDADQRINWRLAELAERSTK